jgi:hypothetical protein
VGLHGHNSRLPGKLRPTDPPRVIYPRWEHHSIIEELTLTKGLTPIGSQSMAISPTRSRSCVFKINGWEKVLTVRRMLGATCSAPAFADVR